MKTRAFDADVGGFKGHSPSADTQPKRKCWLAKTAHLNKAACRALVFMLAIKNASSLARARPAFQTERRDLHAKYIRESMYLKKCGWDKIWEEMDSDKLISQHQHLAGWWTSRGALQIRLQLLCDIFLNGEHYSSQRSTRSEPPYISKKEWRERDSSEIRPPTRPFDTSFVPNKGPLLLHRIRRHEIKGLQLVGAICGSTYKSQYKYIVLPWSRHEKPTRLNYNKMVNFYNIKEIFSRFCNMKLCVHFSFRQSCFILYPKETCRAEIIDLRE